MPESKRIMELTENLLRGVAAIGFVVLGACSPGSQPERLLTNNTSVAYDPGLAGCAGSPYAGPALPGACPEDQRQILYFIG